MNNQHNYVLIIFLACMFPILSACNAQEAPKKDVGSKYKEVPDPIDQQFKHHNDKRQDQKREKSEKDIGERYKATPPALKNNDKNVSPKQVPNGIIAEAQPAIKAGIYNPYERVFHFLLVTLPRDTVPIDLNGLSEYVLSNGKQYELITDPVNKKCKSQLLPDNRYVLKYDTIIKCFIADLRRIGH